MLELAIILFLLVFNGVFAMAEIALVSANRARFQQRAAEGDQGATLALELAKNRLRAGRDIHHLPLAHHR